MANFKQGPQEYLFVDGYNVINTWEILKSDLDNLDEAREKLIEILVEYQAFSAIDITLVFDAHLVKGNNGTREERNGLKIIYTKENETADHYIERSIDQIGRLKRVRVATSDNLEQQIILGRGATRISSRELESEIFGSRERVGKNLYRENEKNNYKFGRLDDKTIESLKKLDL